MTGNAGLHGLLLTLKSELRECLNHILETGAAEPRLSADPERREGVLDLF